MKKILTSVIFLSACSLVQAQTFSWATPFSFDDYNIGNSIRVDATGNSFVTGSYYITGSAGPPTGTSGCFIAKFNNAGTMMWSDTIRNSDAGGSRVDVDAAGNVYLASHVTGTHMIGGTSVTSAGFRDIVIAKYNSSGALQWVKTAGGTANDAAQGIAVDAAGNVYVDGYFGNTASFDGTMKTAVGYADIFIAKYSAAGTLLWVQTASGDADTTSGVGLDEARDLALDNAGNPVLVGYYARGASFGGTTLTSPGVAGGFIAEVDALGNWVWAKNTGSSPTGIEMDNTGNGYVSGSFAGTITIGTNTLTSAGSTDIYLAKFDNSGAFTWVEQSGGVEEDRGYDVSLDNTGNPHITGSFMGNTMIGDTSLVISGEENAYIAKYDVSGNFIWAKQVKANPGAWEFVNSHAIDLDGANNPHITGSFFAAAIFDSFSFTSGNPSDAFVAKLNVAVATGLLENTAGNYTVYNEGNNIVYLEYDNTAGELIQIQVMNALGQCVYTKNMLVNGKGRERLSLPETAGGLYLINIISATKSEANRIFIK